MTTPPSSMVSSAPRSARPREQGEVEQRAGETPLADDEGDAGDEADDERRTVGDVRRSRGRAP